MRLCKYALLVAVIVGGWWTGYAMKDRRAVVKVASRPAKTDAPVSPTEPVAPDVDPRLILPPVSAQGTMIDMPIGDISSHFRDKAGLKPKAAVVDDGPPLLPPEPELFPSDLPKPDPTNVRPATANREPDLLPPPVIRLPAPPEEPPSLSPTVKRVLHRQIAMWMYVSQRDLRLNFDVTRRGSSGIKAVELWVRRSSEQDYECVDRMVGDKPPFATRLWSEGNYELRLVFVSGSGVKSPAPSRNDLPDVYVCLDTTPPVVELLPPSADEPGVTKLRWKAFDTNMEEQAIRLQYSVDGDNWEPIGEANEWLPNTSEFAWKVPAGLPHEMHLRIQARDKAGNIGEACSRGKFSVDMVVPEGRISGVVERGPEPRNARTSAPFPLLPPAQSEDGGVKIVLLTSIGFTDSPEKSDIDRLLCAEFSERLGGHRVDNVKGVQVLMWKPLNYWKSVHPSWRIMSPYDIGNEFKADYVIDVIALNLTFFEPEAQREKLRGSASVVVRVFDLSKKSKEPAFQREFKLQWPLLESADSADIPITTFQKMFVKRLADDLVEPFIGAPVSQGCTLPPFGAPAVEGTDSPPQFPQEPDFPLLRELSYSEEAIGLLGQQREVLPEPLAATTEKEMLPQPRDARAAAREELLRQLNQKFEFGEFQIVPLTHAHEEFRERETDNGNKTSKNDREMLPNPREVRVIIQTEDEERPNVKPEFDQSRELLPMPSSAMITILDFKFADETNRDIRHILSHIRELRQLHGMLGCDFDPSLIQKESARIADFLRCFGFLDVQMQCEPERDNDREAVKIVLRIDEGKPYRVKNIRFEGNKSYDDATLRNCARLSVGAQYYKTEVQAGLPRIRDFYLARGQAVVVRERVQRSGNGTVDVTYRIREPEPMGWFLEEFLPKRTPLAIASEYEPRYTLPPSSRLKDQTYLQEFLSERQEVFLESLGCKIERFKYQGWPRNCRD